MAFPAAILGMLVRPVAVVFSALRSVNTVITNRKVLGQLGQLDDRMLRDIGITRHDVNSAMAEPLFRDPTIQLVDRALEGRMAARASARERLALAQLLNSWTNDSRAA